MPDEDYERIFEDAKLSFLETDKKGELKDILEGEMKRRKPPPFIPIPDPAENGDDVLLPVTPSLNENQTGDIRRLIEEANLGLPPDKVDALLALFDSVRGVLPEGDADKQKELACVVENSGLGLPKNDAAL